MKKTTVLTNGQATAALLAAGIGSMALGVFTILAQTLPYWKNLLNLWNPAGPLSGKTTAAVLVWLVSWAILHVLWKDKEMNFTRIFVVVLILIGLGFLGTFPPFFEMFGH